MNRLMTAAAVVLISAPVSALADAHASPMVMANDQSVANGVVSADSVMAAENGWLVVHRTEDGSTPGPVVGHAPLRGGENTDVAAILTESVAPGDMLMLMVHAETGGMQTGVFEYTLGAKEDGPIKVNDALVMSVITAE